MLFSSLALILLFWQWRPMGGVIWQVQASLAQGLPGLRLFPELLQGSREVFKASDGPAGTRSLQVPDQHRAVLGCQDRRPITW